MSLLISILDEFGQQMLLAIGILPDIIGVSDIDQFVLHARMRNVEESCRLMRNAIWSPGVRSELADRNAISFRGIENDAGILDTLKTMHSADKYLRSACSRAWRVVSTVDNASAARLACCSSTCCCCCLTRRSSSMALRRAAMVASPSCPRISITSRSSRALSQRTCSS